MFDVLIKAQRTSLTDPVLFLCRIVLILLTLSTHKSSPVLLTKGTTALFAASKLASLLVFPETFGWSRVGEVETCVDGGCQRLNFP